VLDVSGAALEVAQSRLGDAPVRWLQQDLLTWEPDRRYELWHDRALFHFFVDPADRDRYLELIRTALRPNGYVILATFASDGPPQCSGLPVTRWSADELGTFLGEDFEMLERRREDHQTPGGDVQPFTWVVARYKEVS
jgi:hypothetical protein